MQPSKRAPPVGGAGNAALRNSDGTDNGKRFILAFAIGVPLLLIIVAAVWYFRRRRLKKRRAQEKTPEGRKAKNTGEGKKKRKTKKNKSVWERFRLPSRIKPAATPDAYKRNKDMLPTI
jgi:H+/gluconate symporter-like permease